MVWGVKKEEKSILIIKLLMNKEIIQTEKEITMTITDISGLILAYRVMKISKDRKRRNSFMMEGLKPSNSIVRERQMDKGRNKPNLCVFLIGTFIILK